MFSTRPARISISIIYCLDNGRTRQLATTHREYFSPVEAIRLTVAVNLVWLHRRERIAGCRRLEAVARWISGSPARSAFFFRNSWRIYIFRNEKRGSIRCIGLKWKWIFSFQVYLLFSVEWMVVIERNWLIVWIICLDDDKYRRKSKICGITRLQFKFYTIDFIIYDIWKWLIICIINVSNIINVMFDWCIRNGQFRKCKSI